MSGNSKTMHSGILINTPYLYDFLVAVIDSLPVVKDDSNAACDTTTPDANVTCEPMRMSGGLDGSFCPNDAADDKLYNFLVFSVTPPPVSLQSHYRHHH